MFTLDIEEDLSLALVQPSFASQYFAIVSAEQDALSQWLAWPPHADGEEFFSQFIQQALHDYADGKSLTCAIVYRGQIVGNVGFNHINKALKKAEIGYWLSARYQGLGIVSKSVRVLIGLAFEELNLENVLIFAAEGNWPSRRVCERLGFTLEGIITGAENIKGRLFDHAAYTLNVSDWRK
ncbi:GNAT family N-acetyltransferase [Vibrio profundum]|uniref:GNAT family N-acetyltransferase n=1 Tax=Vibrio profundum TaxID=2910247 RepID=UPI003D104E39